MAWTKEDFDANYSFRVERYYGTYPAGSSRPELRVNYHKWAVKPLLDQMWATLAPILAVPSTERVLIVGAGFGWGVDAFIAETGCTTVGVDVSDYINTEQGNTEEAELRQNIVDVGLDPDTGDGAFLLSQIYDGQPRANVVVLQEDMQTNTSRQAIRSALGGWPDVVIFEDLIDDTTTDEEITQANNAANLFSGTQRVIWVTARDRPGRTLQQLQTLTGSEVITRDGTVHLVP